MDEDRAVDIEDEGAIGRGGEGARHPLGVIGHPVAPGPFADRPGGPCGSGVNWEDR